MKPGLLQQQVVWITGASGGLGEALAISASRRGARLVLSARRGEELQRVRALCADPAQVAVLPLDLLAFDAEAARAAAEAFFGPIDVLVNNAGISQRSAVVDTQMDVYRRILELDFFAPVALSKAVIPGMRARGRGQLVTISSVVGKVGTPQRSGYAAAKHALHGFFDAARAELARDGLRVTLVCPGYVRTQMSINAVTGDGRAHAKMDPGQVSGMDALRAADKIWRGVERGREELYLGREQAIIYLKRWCPALVSMIIRRVNRP